MTSKSLSRLLIKSTHTQRILDPIDLKAGTVFINGSTHFKPRGCPPKSGCKKKLLREDSLLRSASTYWISFSLSLLHVDDHHRRFFLVDPDCSATIDLNFCLAIFQRWWRRRRQVIRRETIGPRKVNKTGRVFHPEGSVVAVLH